MKYGTYSKKGESEKDSTKPKDLTTSLLCYVIYGSLKPTQQANLHGPNNGYQNV